MFVSRFLLEVLNWVSIKYIGLISLLTALTTAPLKLSLFLFLLMLCLLRPVTILGSAFTANFVPIQCNLQIVVTS